MPTRQLAFEVFDADNHLYETRDALTKFLPDRYRSAITFVEAGGATRLAVRGQISDYVRDPTFERVFVPGAHERRRDGARPDALSRLRSRAMIPPPPSYREPAPRVALMDELGIDRTMLYPTLATVVEERMLDDPELCHAVIHAMNEWLLEQWSFDYQGRIFATPIITPALVERAVGELEWALSCGARAVLMRPAPAWGHRGPRSFALPEFDPYWRLAEESGVVVVMHSSDGGFWRYVNEWEGATGEWRSAPATPGFLALMAGFRPIEHMVASLIGHGALQRFPGLKIAIVENGAGWVGSTVANLRDAYERSPAGTFTEDPVAVFRRNIWVHPSREDDPCALIELIGADRVLFGSDFPHPEGMADPITYVDDLAGLPDDIVARIMGGNLAALLGVA